MIFRLPTMSFSNSKIRWVRRMDCSYRNRKRFHHAIYFHLAALDLYASAVAVAKRLPGRITAPGIPPM